MCVCVSVISCDTRKEKQLWFSETDTENPRLKYAKLLLLILMFCYVVLGKLIVGVT